MLKKLKQATTSTKGESYIYVCVLVLVISMLVSIVVMYMGLMAQVQIQKRDVATKLDSCISEFAVEAYDSIKQGESYDSVIDMNKLKQNAYTKLGFSASDITFEYDNGNCTMTRPTITTLVGDGFGLTVKYTVSFPIKWGGNTYADLTVPVTITRYYKMKG